MAFSFLNLNNNDEEDVRKNEVQRVALKYPAFGKHGLYRVLSVVLARVSIYLITS